MTLTTPTGARPLAAYYAIFVEPLELVDGGTGIELVVVLIDPAFACVPHAKVSSLDSISFTFLERRAGESSTTVLSRRGPTLGGATGGVGGMGLSVVDDRYVDVDGGAILVEPGGTVGGKVSYTLDGGLAIRGRFTAPHCAALDFAFRP